MKHFAVLRDGLYFLLNNGETLTILAQSEPLATVAASPFAYETFENEFIFTATPPGTHLITFQTKTKKMELHVLVHPTFQLGNTTIKCSDLSIQTLLTANCGPLSAWPGVLGQARAAGYNAVHLSPVQPLGASASAYSLNDQLALAESLACTRPQFEALLAERSLLFITDLVLNHTANSTPWLALHPEAAFNTRDCVWLRPAYHLDSLLAHYSASLLNLVIRDGDHVKALLDAFFLEWVQPARLWEYFVVDIEQLQAEYQSITPPSSTSSRSIEGKAKFPPDKEEFIENDESLWRHCVKVSRKGLESFSDWSRLKEAAEVYNLKQYQRYDERIAKMKQNILNSVSYERLDPSGPLAGPITAEAPFCKPYFTTLQTGGELNGSDAPFPQIAVAHNGWVWASQEDFSARDSDSYFTRNIIIWNDSVKLRYGQGPSDNPWLWQHMLAYVTWTARHFDGVRLDNAHSTPLHVAKYFVSECRKVNPNLFVFAELFTGSEAADHHYCFEVGVNALVRETIHASSSSSLIGLLQQHVVWPDLGGLRQGDESYWGQGRVPALLYDQTHDNESYLASYPATLPLGLTALLHFCPTAIGSTRGVDELVPHRIDLVTDKRPYSTTISPTRLRFRSLLAEIRQRLGDFVDAKVDTVDNLFRIRRYSPDSGSLITLLVHLSWSASSPISTGIPTAAKVLLHAYDEEIEDLKTWQRQEGVVNGLTNVVFLSQSEIGPDFTLPLGAALIYEESVVTGELSELIYETARLNIAPTEANIILFRCEDEEREIPLGGCYDVPSFKRFTYAGLASLFQSLLAAPQFLLTRHRLGIPHTHPLLLHFQENHHWLLGYHLSRLGKYAEQGANLTGPISVISRFILLLDSLQHTFLRPKFLFLFCSALFDASSKLLTPSSPFPFLARALVLSTLAVVGHLPSSPLIVASKNFLPHPSPSIAAGLPHFSVGYMRSWGRDTFISFQGALLLPRRYEEARHLLLAYAANVRHGLVCNLLDSSNSPRFNARDAVWFFLQAVQDYVKATEDEALLSTLVPSFWGEACTFMDLIQSIMQKHAEGIDFREHNAGPAIDDRMKDEGFNVQIRLQEETGFLLGGNVWNCGTWMDNMGQSAQAGNRGQPATPRDGAPIELVGLLWSCTAWLAARGPGGVQTASGALSWAEWAARLRQHFEQHFWIPATAAEDAQYDVAPALVHRRAHYKDVVGSQQAWAPYQLRPNQCIAMAVAPDLFDPEHARQALRTIKVLLGPLGMRTLDPQDAVYRPNYINGLETDDFLTSKGFNYHQGPEWLWPLGFYIRAFRHFSTASKNDQIEEIRELIAPHQQHIVESDWLGLPELTNQDGQPCPSSCPIQAWSMATILHSLSFE